MKKKRVQRPPDVVSEVALGAGLFLGRLDTGDVRIRIRTKKLEGVWEIPDPAWRQAINSTLAQ